MTNAPGAAFSSLGPGGREDGERNLSRQSSTRAAKIRRLLARSPIILSIAQVSIVGSHHDRWQLERHRGAEKIITEPPTLVDGHIRPV